MSTLGNNILMEYWRQNQNAIPTDGLVFYAPLDKYATHAVTGQLITNNGSGSETYETFNNIPCVSLSGNRFFEASSGIASKQDFTHSVWLKGSGGNFSTSTFNASSCLGYPVKKVQLFSGWMSLVFDGNKARPSSYSGMTTSYEIEGLNTTQWHNYLITFTNSTNLATLYIDGDSRLNWTYTTLSESYPGDWTKLNSGAYNNSYTGSATNQKLSGWRLYNRVLTDAEIATLASEFTPTS